MTNNRVCVFCGRRPDNKTKEHVLPQWLLRMTGDPNRVVRLGVNPATNAPIEFSWSALVMPACASCNEEYSRLEAAAQPIVGALVSRQSLPGERYLTLLDWLDKVRVGLWLAYYVLQKNQAGIAPSFRIASRVGAKDRFVALYPIDTQVDGLNAFGVESLVFQRSPSCLGLRVNSLLILNASSDYLVAARCGFPFPRERELYIDGPNAGFAGYSDFRLRRRVMHPILRERLIKRKRHLNTV